MARSACTIFYTGIYLDNKDIDAQIQARTHSRTRVHAPHTHTHTHARTHVRTHTHTHIHTYTHTHVSQGKGTEENVLDSALLQYNFNVSPCGEIRLAASIYLLSFVFVCFSLIFIVTDWMLLKGQRE